jgi:hypothetical protein
MSTIMFRTVVEMKQLSVKDKLERKYMGVWRWVSNITARKTRMFPRMVIRYMHRNSPKRMGCSYGSSDSLMR